MKNAAHVVQLPETLDSFKLIEVEAIKFFDKEGLFRALLETIGYVKSFPWVREQSEESQNAREKNQGLVIDIEQIAKELSIGMEGKNK